MTDFYHSWAPCAKAVPPFRQTTKLKNSGDTVLISAAAPPVPPVDDVVRDAGGDHRGNARHGFSNPRFAPQNHMVPREDVEDLRGYQVTNVVYLRVSANCMSLRSNSLTTDERSVLRLLAIR